MGGHHPFLVHQVESSEQPTERSGGKRPRSTKPDREAHGMLEEHPSSSHEEKFRDCSGGQQADREVRERWMKLAKPR
jgi:hypothetical protein